MQLSLRASVLLFAALCGAPAAGAVAQPASTQASASASEAARELSRRIDRLLPSMLGSLAAARRENEPALIRCFDRAVSELNSLRRQVAFHAERRASAREPSEQLRHQRALHFLAQRVDELAHSGETCFTDGVWLAPGQTQVEVVFSPR